MNYDPKYYKVYNIYDTDEKRFRMLIRYSYYNQLIAERKFLMTGVNFNNEVAKDADSTDGAKTYLVNLFFTMGVLI